MISRPKFEEGELFLIPFKNGQQGSARVIRVDNFGCLFEIYRNEATSDVLEVAYVNRSSVRKAWKTSGEFDLGAVTTKELPTFFYGNNVSGWTIQEGKKTHWIKPESATVSELRNLGYVHKVLWLADDIRALLEEGAPLVWPDLQQR